MGSQLFWFSGGNVIRAVLWSVGEKADLTDLDEGGQIFFVNVCAVLLTLLVFIHHVS